MSVHVIAKPGENKTLPAGSRASVFLAVCAFVIAAVVPIKEVAFGLALIVLVVFRPLTLQQVMLVLAKSWPVLAMLAIALVMTLVDVTGDIDNRSVARIIFYYVRVPTFLLLGFAARRHLADDRSILWSVVAVGVLAVGQTLYTYATAGNLSGLDHNQVRGLVGTGDTNSILIPLCALTLWSRTRNVVLRLMLVAASGLAVLGTIAVNSRTGLLVLAISAVLSLPRIRPLLVARWGSVLILVATLILTTPILLPILDLLGIDPLRLTALSEVIARQRTDLFSINNEWRGYETYMAFVASYADGFGPLLFGHGLSVQAPLGVYIELAPDQYFDRIDVFHNGWSFVILHSGIIGVVLYIAQFFVLTKPAGNSRSFIRDDNRLFALTTLVMAASTSAVAGIFNAGNLASVQLFLLGCFYPFSLVRVPSLAAAWRPAFRMARPVVPAQSR